MRDEDVKPAVAVVVEKSGSRSPSHRRSADPGLLGDVLERPVGAVAVEHVAPPIGDEEIVEPVVVVITDRHRRRPARSFEPGLLGHIAERAVAVVVVKTVRGRGGRVVPPDSRQEKDIDPAIVVVVDKGRAGAHGFNNVVFFGDAAVNDGRGQAGLLGDIHEAGVKRPTGGLAARRRLNPARGRTLPVQRRRHDRCQTQK